MLPSVISLILLSVSAFAGELRVMPAGQPPPDDRLVSVRDTDTVFTMPHFDSVEDWETYAAGLRRRILLGSGLYPLPERTPLNPHVFDWVQRDGYAFAKVYFEAWPGFLVTGNLFRPDGAGPFPAVLNPHGHWEHGRLDDSERGSVAARCITLARMGAVALSIDMVGYNDSRQFDHRFEDRELKLWGIHPFSLQLWSSIRSIDFLESLPYVDGDRVGVTGASGGGTQTFAVMAVDPRVKVAAPVNMISSTMQGGCVCENAPLLRLHNSNMEIGALMAPRPLLLVSATGDWTRETPRVEFPAIKSIYALYGEPDRIENVHIDAPHNYNQQSREAMYRFFGKWLLGAAERYADFTEPEYEMPPLGQLRVFPDDLPDTAMSRSDIVEGIKRILARRTADTMPRGPRPGENTVNIHREFRDLYRPAHFDVLGTEIPDVNDLTVNRRAFAESDGNVEERWLIGRRAHGEAIPTVVIRKADHTRCPAVVIVHGRGKAAVDDSLIAEQLKNGHAVVLVDVFGTGEFDGADRARGKFPDTFHPTDTASRVQDVLTVLAFVRSRRDLSRDIKLIGLEDGGLWAAIAAALDDTVASGTFDGHTWPVEYRWDGMSFGNGAEWAERFYIPSFLSIGGMQTVTAMGWGRDFQVLNARPPVRAVK